jgi:hypothetical protein
MIFWGAFGRLHRPSMTSTRCMRDPRVCLRPTTSGCWRRLVSRLWRGSPSAPLRSTSPTRTIGLGNGNCWIARGMKHSVWLVLSMSRLSQGWAAYFGVSTAEFLSVLHATIERGRDHRCALERPTGIGEFKPIAARRLHLWTDLHPGRRPRAICYGGAERHCRAARPLLGFMTGFKINAAILIASGTLGLLLLWTRDGQAGVARCDLRLAEPIHDQPTQVGNSIGNLA